MKHRGMWGKFKASSTNATTTPKDKIDIENKLIMIRYTDKKRGKYELKDMNYCVKEYVHVDEMRERPSGTVVLCGGLRYV